MNAAPPALLPWLSRRTLGHITWAAALASVAFFVFFRVHDRPLQPFTIIDFEFARSPDRARELFSAWGAAGMQVARESLLVDFGFMPAYALAFAGAVLLTARKSAGWRRRVGAALFALPIAAAVLDAIENVALLWAMSNPTEPSPSALVIAATAAGVKFGLLAVCIVYLLVAAALGLAGRVRSAR